MSVPAEDRIPNERAVWREGRPSEFIPASVLVSVDYGDGLIEQTRIADAAWERARQFRFGWPPA